MIVVISKEDRENLNIIFKVASKDCAKQLKTIWINLTVYL